MSNNGCPFLFSHAGNAVQAQQENPANQRPRPNPGQVGWGNGGWWCWQGGGAVTRGQVKGKCSVCVNPKGRCILLPSQQPVRHVVPTVSPGSPKPCGTDVLKSLPTQ